MYNWDGGHCNQSSLNTYIVEFLKYLKMIKDKNNFVLKMKEVEVIIYSNHPVKPLIQLVLLFNTFHGIVNVTKYDSV